MCCRRIRWSSDHPRTCGANANVEPASYDVTGSSPHMRGKPLRSPMRLMQFRIIPAHAGQTRQVCGAREETVDHPRTCGANQTMRLLNWKKSGSSPHMRGKLADRVLLRGLDRIIPAHAGQTVVPSSPLNLATDHPRTCGANISVFGTSSSNAGSSPHMRGKRPCRRALEIVGRIIPAHAGQTRTHTHWWCPIQDHPRTCGANYLWRSEWQLYPGSSPHMRGKPIHTDRLQ